MYELLAPLLLAAGATCPPEVHPSYAVAPEYAEAVELSHVSASGLVKVSATVSASGQVSAVAVTNGSSPFLYSATINAARQWKFAMQQGQTASCVVELVFEYTLVPSETAADGLGTRFHYPRHIEVRARRPRRGTATTPSVQ
jgi:hypothetical protein